MTSSVAKKKVATAAALGSSMEAFPTAGLALQLEVPTVAVASIHVRKVGEQCCNSSRDGRLDAVPVGIPLEEVAASI
jgi:hypothetical protein